MIEKRKTAKKETAGSSVDSVERQKVEKELQKSEAALSTIFNIVGTGIIVIDGETLRILEINQTATDIMGRTREKIVGQICHSFICPAEVGKCPIKDLGQSIDNSARKIICADGQRKDILKNVSPFIYKGRKCYLESFIDITDRKRAEEEQKKSEERLREVLENSIDVAYKRNLQNDTYDYLSPSFARISGYAPGEMNALPLETVENLMHPDDTTEVQRVIAESMTNPDNKPYQMEYRFKHKQGHYRWFQDRYTVMRDERGQPLALIGSVSDITERKRAEEALRESDLRFKELFNHMNSGLAVYEAINTGEDFIFKDFNPAAERIEKVGREDIVGKRVSEVFPGIKEFGIFEVFQRVWQTGKAEYFPQNIYIDDRDPGSWRESWVFKLPGGEIAAIYNDITERKQVEAYQEMGRQVLQILNEPGDLQDCIQRVLAELKTRTGLDAVGIRLQDGDDFPYFAQDGFSTDFLLTENTLTERGADGGLCRNKNGSVSLECTCGLVISGKTDPANPLFTPGGSSWTNDSFPFLDVPAEEDPRFHPRNECIHQGYASVALVPIRNKNGIVGLIQFNDRRKGCFSHDAIEQFESIAAHIGEALIRKVNEKALARSEEKFRLLIENSHDIIYTLTPEGVFNFVSPAWTVLLGHPVNQVAGHAFQPFVHPDDLAGCMSWLQKVVETDQRQEGVEYRVRHVDGSWRWHTSSAVPLRDTTGMVIGFEGIARDISERKQAEEALRESEERYRSILEQMYDGYYEVDLAGKYTFVNDASCRNLGYSREELIGNSFQIALSENEAKAVFQAYHNVYLSGEPNKGFIFEVLRKDGTVGFAESSITLLKNNRGELVGFRSVGRDITERKQAEEALRSAEEKYRSLVENINDIFYMLDNQGNITFISPAVERLTKYKISELMGKPVFPLVHPDDLPGLLESFNQLVSGQLVPWEFRLLDKDGRVIFVRTSRQLLYKDGKVVGVTAVMTDLTERKQMEQKLEEMATHDFLTGLPNRVLLTDRFTMAAALAQRNKDRLAVMSLDLDKFKTINDTLGHAAGDQVLKTVSARLTGIIRASDTLARIGGDEFILVMIETNREKDATAIAQKILEAFEEPLFIDGQRVQLSTSIGIATYPEDGEDMETLTQKSDAALYYAKGHGRNQFKFFGDGDVQISGDHKSALIKI